MQLKPFHLSHQKTEIHEAYISTQLISHPSLICYHVILIVYYNLWTKRKLSSCNGSYVPTTILHFGNLFNISSDALEGDINGSFLESNNSGMYDSKHSFKTVWCSTYIIYLKIQVSSKATRKLGVNVLISRDNAG